MTPEERKIASALVNHLPSVSDLFGPQEISSLARAWADGNARAFLHPFIEALLGRIHRHRRSGLNTGMKLLRAQGNDLKSHVNRLTLESTNTPAFIEARGAMNELWAATACVTAGANVTFQATGRDRTPDIVGKVHGSDFTLEVTSVNLPDDQVREGNRLKYAFTKWKKSAPMPEVLRGRASDDGHSRTLQMRRRILGTGNIDDRVQTLAWKKGSNQLKGRANAVLVMSARHQWGIASQDCLPRRRLDGGLYSGVCYAAAYGRKGDYLFEGEEFEGRGHEVIVQSGDGLLRRSGSISAVLFLFQVPRDVLLENLQSGSGFSHPNVARFIATAFDVDKATSVLKRR